MVLTMTTLPMVPIVLPSSVSNQRNGAIDNSLLHAITPRGRLLANPARAWEEMRLHALVDGFVLEPTSDPDTYRLLSIQQSAWNTRMSPTYLPGRPTRTDPTGKVWWLRSGFAWCAWPGTSNHGWASAIDIGVRVNGTLISISSDPDGSGPAKPGIDWLIKHAALYGFSWELQSEPWHVRYVLGDLLPLSVPPLPVKLGDRGAEVVHLKRILAAWGCRSGIGGWELYGTGVRSGVRQLQHKLKVPTTGAWDTRTIAAYRSLSRALS